MLPKRPAESLHNSIERPGMTSIEDERLTTYCDSEIETVSARSCRFSRTFPKPIETLPDPFHQQQSIVIGERPDFKTEHKREWDSKSSEPYKNPHKFQRRSFPVPIGLRSDQSMTSSHSSIVKICDDEESKI